MSIRILAIGKRHEPWVSDGIDSYERRLRKPFGVKWQLLPHSAREGEAARADESERILARLDRDAFVVLLDERGQNVDSPTLARTLQGAFAAGQSVSCVIGGAYGVDERVRQRADFAWSLSKLVFPHQLVRLVLAEQLYRAHVNCCGKWRVFRITRCRATAPALNPQLDRSSQPTNEEELR